MPEYGTLEELAKEENGSIDTHDGISIISMGEKVKEGILISWYVYSDEGRPSIVIGYKTPSLDTDTPPLDMPTISGSGRQYEIKELSANPYWDNMGQLPAVGYKAIRTAPQMPVRMFPRRNRMGLSGFIFRESRF